MGCFVPKVSIIIPCWNSEAYIEDAISSCIEQNYPNLEIIVINDGSTDLSGDIINGFGDRIRSFHLPNGGANKARNIGISKATGQYIKMLDADDMLEKECIQKQVHCLSGLGENQIGYGQHREIDSYGHFLGVEHSVQIGRVIDLKHLMKRGLLISLPLYPRSALLKVSGFDERLRSRQEWNLHIRMSLHGYLFKECDVSCFRQRHHASPFRISNRSPAPADEFKNLSEAIEPLKNIADPEICELLALRFWSVGRWYAIKNPSWAKEFFKAAKEYDDRNFFDLLPHLYVKILRYSNPFIAEIADRLLKKMFIL
ncbi:MAG: glycosyltransferase family 2 protein [Alcanivorax sp.]